MDRALAQEARRAGRYTIVRIVSRGSDFILFGLLLYWWGMEWFITSFILTSALDFLIDFWGQKLWAFKNPNKKLRELLREFCSYIAIRGTFIGAAASTMYSLQSFVGLPQWKAALITIAIFWTMAFPLYRWVFTGSLKDLFSMLSNVGRK